MNRQMKLVLTGTSIAALSFALTGCDKLKARDNINKGVGAYKSAKYPQAVQYFRNAIELDPQYSVARTYLAMACMNQWTPGASSPENQANFQCARDEFQKVIDAEPKNAVAIESVASMYYNQAGAQTVPAERMKKLDEAKTWYTKLVDADPKAKTGWYSLGVITYNKVFADRAAARSASKMKLEDPGPLKDAKIRTELRAKNAPLIEQGVQDLEKALQVDPEYDDAMAYLNLLYRERADIQDTQEAYKKDTDTADKYLEQTLSTKKTKAARVLNAPGGVKAAK